MLLRASCSSLARGSTLSLFSGSTTTAVTASLSSSWLHTLASSALFSPPPPSNEHEHVIVKGSVMNQENYVMPHPLWPPEYVESVQPSHRKPENMLDRLAKLTINTMRFNFDILTGYLFGKMTEDKVLTRVIFLETVAGVPGSVAAMCRHLTSLRAMQRDHGWIHTLLEEAENERMHLIVALTEKQPGPLFRSFVWLAQGVFFNFFFAAYLVAPRFCHRMVGYLEEEAVVTYTKIIHAIDDGTLSVWKTKPAPEVAVQYWQLSPTATMRDVFCVIRADENHHRLVNHELASLSPHDTNPFVPGGMKASAASMKKTIEARVTPTGPPVYPKAPSQA